MASSSGARGCKFELIDDGRLRVCFCQKCDCFLGGGTYGKVFKATAMQGNKGAVAIKCPSSECQVDYEIAILQRLVHRNILKYYREFRFGFIRVLETELCNGTLHDLVVSLKLYDAEIYILRQSVEGLAHLHDKKIVHRDLKPRNILYSLSGQGVLLIKLADFGCSRTLPVGGGSHYSLSKTRDASYHTIFRPFGTDGWLAPEVLNGDQRYTYKGDIYPLGLIFCFTLCKGFHPFGDDSTTRNDHIRKGEQMLPEIRQILEERMDGSYDLIVKMLNPNPDERPTTAEILKNEFFIGVKRNQTQQISSSDVAAAVDDVSVSFAQLSSDNKGKVIRHRNAWKENELIHLCRCERMDEAQFVRFRQLVEDKEVDVNCAGAWGSTPLISFCGNNKSDGFFDCVDLLLQRPDIKINQTSKDGHNALMALCQSSKSEKIVEVAQLLIENKGIDVNQTNEYGMNALMLLCGWSENDKIVEVARLLIANGIDINRTNIHGFNALIWLFNRSKSVKIVQVSQLLIANGIDINQTNKLGENALIFWCTRSESDVFLEVAQLLIDSGIDINQTGEGKCNALMFACLWSESEKIIKFAKLLIAKGIDINQTDKNGKKAFNILEENMRVPLSKRRDIATILKLY